MNIIELAKQVGFSIHDEDSSYMEMLYSFAALVRAQALVEPQEPVAQQPQAEKHASWCASRSMLMSNPPQSRPCDCKPHRKTAPQQAEAVPSDVVRDALELAEEALGWHASGFCEDSMPQLTVEALYAIRAAIAQQKGGV